MSALEQVFSLFSLYGTHFLHSEDESVWYGQSLFPMFSKTHLSIPLLLDAECIRFIFKCKHKIKLPFVCLL